MHEKRAVQDPRRRNLPVAALHPLNPILQHRVFLCIWQFQQLRNGLMSPLASAVNAFLSAHRQPMLDLVKGAGVLDRHMVEVHGLAGFARMFPEQAQYMRLQVAPPEGSPGSVVMSSALCVEGQWFELEGPRELEEIFDHMKRLASEEETVPCAFVCTSEPGLPRSPHSVIQPYLQQHFPAFLAAAQADCLDQHTGGSAHQARGPRL